MSKGGFKLARRIGSAPNSGGSTQLTCENSVTGAMFKGDPVKTSAGNVQIGANGVEIIGVFGGAAWIDPTTKKPVFQSFIPAGTSSGGSFEGKTTPVVNVIDSGLNVFAVEAEGTISAGNAYGNHPVTITAGDAVMGVSQAKVKAAVNASLSACMVEVIRISPVLGNALDDATPEVEVEFLHNSITGVRASVA